MLNNPVRGPGRGSYIGGKSVHNQRIERLWRDVTYGCTGMYFDLFCHLEENMMLDISNVNHLFALQWTFIPRIQRALDLFSDGWNNHPMRSENNHSPYQLWFIGMGKDVYKECDVSFYKRFCKDNFARKC